MKETKISEITLVATLSLALILLFCGTAVAQTQIQGVIDGRSGATMTVKTQDAGNVVVLLTDSQQRNRVHGAEGRYSTDQHPGTRRDGNQQAGGS